MPHQVAYEYLNVRLKEIEKVRANYAGMRKQLTDAEQDADAEEAKRSLASSAAYFDELEAGFPKPSNSPEDDEVWSAIDELFDGKVGSPYDPEEKAKILEKGEQRYTDRVPPGYKDQGKGEEKYGDLLIWFQMLEKAEQDTRPIVFVTHDQKEDLWWKSQGKVIGPRHELVEAPTPSGLGLLPQNKAVFGDHAPDAQDAPL